MDPITNRGKVEVSGSKSVANRYKKDAVVAADANLVDEAPARASFESSDEEGCKGCRSCQNAHRTCSRIRRNKHHKSSELDSIVSRSDTDTSRKARRYCHVERTDLAESASDYSISRDCYRTHKMAKALEDTSHKNGHYKEGLDFSTYRLPNLWSWYDDQGARNVVNWA